MARRAEVVREDQDARIKMLLELPSPCLQVPKYGLYMLSILGTVLMILGTYAVFR